MTTNREASDFPEFPQPRTDGADAAGPVPYIEAIVAGLGQVSVAVPVIFATIRLVRDLWRRARPAETDLTDAQLIDLMDAKFTEIERRADDEIARLRGEL